MEKESMKSRLAEFITTAKSEIDHLKVQLALGKMEASDLYEQTKADMLPRLEELKNTAGKKGAEKLQASVDTLRLQLAMGKAVALDSFMDQQQKITKAIEQLEQEMRQGNYGLPDDLTLKIKNELYKFRLKTDILKIKYELGKLELKEDAEKSMHAFSAEIKNLFANVRENTEDALEDAGEGLKHAYSKMKSVFK